MVLSKRWAFKPGLTLLLTLALASSLIAQENKAQQPAIMVIPSDNLLKSLNCLRAVDNRGDTVYIRDYQKAFVNSSDLSFIISSIQERFAEKGFPLKDLEQTLKSVQQRAASDLVEGYDRDARAELLNVARPDIFIDLNYNLEKKGMSCILFITLRAIDAYSMKSVANAQNPGVETLNCNAKDALARQTELNLNNFQQLLNDHFADIRQNGREIAVEIRVEGGAVDDLRRDKCGDRYPYAMWVYNWLREKSLSKTANRVSNTPKILEFSEVRIPLFDKNGTPIAAADWAFDLVEAIMGSCSNISAFDNTQSIGKAVIVLTP